QRGLFRSSRAKTWPPEPAPTISTRSMPASGGSPCRPSDGLPALPRRRCAVHCPRADAASRNGAPAPERAAFASFISNRFTLIPTDSRRKARYIASRLGFSLQSIAPQNRRGRARRDKTPAPTLAMAGVPLAIGPHRTRHLYNLTIIVYGPRRDDRAPGIWSPFEFGLTLSSTRTEHPARMVHSAPGVMPPPSLSTYRPPG